MIALNTMNCLELRLYADDDPRQAEWKKAWSSHKGFELLDTIRCSEEEASKLMEPLETTDQKTITLVENPALREFCLEVSGPPETNPVVIRFKKSILPQPEAKKLGEDGTVMEVMPMLDVYVSNLTPDLVDSVFTIYSFRCFDKDGRVLMTGTTQQENIGSSAAFIALTPDLTTQEYISAQRDIKLTYIAIQHAMYMKPTVFSETSIRRTTVPAPVHKKQKCNRSKVRVVKTIHLNSEELNKLVPSGKHMTCPCWGVIGHWRNYKTGKSVWIEPYRKGKQRHNPAAYMPKEYLMEG